MKALELTKEHKSKLLEMCKRLFPEYKYWSLHDGTCDLCMENTLDFSKEEKPEWNEWDRIHWFEFCMTHLAFRLFNKQYQQHLILKDYINNPEKYPANTEEEKDLVEEIVGDCYTDWDNITQNLYLADNPIDYLYEDFKRYYL